MFKEGRLRDCIPLPADYYYKVFIDDLQPIHWDSEDKGLAAMLVPQTKEVNDIRLFKFHQHGRRDVACKSSIERRAILPTRLADRTYTYMNKMLDCTRSHLFYAK